MKQLYRIGWEITSYKGKKPDVMTGHGNWSEDKKLVQVWIKEANDPKSELNNMKSISKNVPETTDIKINHWMETKNKIETPEDIIQFLKDCGFNYAAPMSGCCEYSKSIEGDDLYFFQINGEGISAIETLDEMVIFSENGKDSDITPLARYTKEYPNLKAMVEAESSRCDFSGGLNKWVL